MTIDGRHVDVVLGVPGAAESAAGTAAQGVLGGRALRAPRLRRLGRQLRRRRGLGTAHP